MSGRRGGSDLAALAALLQHLLVVLELDPEAFVRVRLGPPLPDLGERVVGAESVGVHQVGDDARCAARDPSVAVHQTTPRLGALEDEGGGFRKELFDVLGGVVVGGDDLVGEVVGEVALVLAAHLGDVVEAFADHVEDVRDAAGLEALFVLGALAPAHEQLLPDFEDAIVRGVLLDSWLGLGLELRLWLRPREALTHDAPIACEAPSRSSYFLVALDCRAFPPRRKFIA
mmetsp:Transcript_35266/g.82984  ORF Transcript_35266/g.82984 Transcript_35266/m.82984 type:complete len:229 (-) Transcript_35266:189-875(-)